MPVTTLAEVCEQHVPDGQTIDFLKVDVEGHEREVIRGGDWSRWRPRVVLVEANRPESWEPALLASGYLFAIFDGVNRLFVREEDRHLIPRARVPVNAGDRFLIHGYCRRIAELEESQQRLPPPGRRAGAGAEAYQGIGPTALRVARHLTRAARRHPRASSMMKRLVRRMTA